MGFAKYMEDNYSRYYGASVVRGREHDPFVGGPHSVKDNKEASQVKEQSSKLKEFTLAEARPIPVIVMADVSGSMSADGKIEALNLALKNMIEGFAAESRIRAEIQVGLITFGGESARVHLPLAAAHKISEISPLAAVGRTPMGSAFEEARKLVEDKEKIDSRAYRPVLVLMSDGMPTDDWEVAFDTLCRSERAQKAARFAMAIGAEANLEMLGRFANDPESPVFKGHEARDIHRFFRAVTMSVAARSRSTAPNGNVPLMLEEIPEDDDLDLDF